MNKIHYDAEVIRQESKNCLSIVEDLNTKTPKLKSHMEVNSGEMRNGMDEIILSTEEAFVNTNTLMNQASDFLQKLADYLEQQDKEIAIKMGE